MNTNRQRSFLKCFAAPAAALIAATVIAPGAGHASEAETEIVPQVTEFAVPQLAEADRIMLPNAPGALTAPPPAEPLGNFMQSLAANKYLGATYNQLTAAGSGAVAVSAGTSAQGSGVQVGITVYIQQWNGSAWVNVGSPRSSVAAASVSLNYNTNVTKGYYYRAKSEHTATKGSAYESSSAYSNSVLIPL